MMMRKCLLGVVKASLILPAALYLSTELFAQTSAKGEALFIEGKYREALEEFRPGLESEDPVALFYTAKAFEGGLGVRQDPRAAFELYRKSADKGYNEAKGKMGLLYITGRFVLQDFKKGIKMLQESSVGGSSEASLTLAGLYRQGFAVKKDEKKALEYYRAASGQKSPEADYILAKSYEAGEGTVKDIKKAFEFMQKSAGAMYVPALYAMGEYYSAGTGTPADKVQAHAHYNLASSMGSGEANKKLNELSAEMSVEDAVKAQEAAASLYKK